MSTKEQQSRALVPAAHKMTGQLALSYEQAKDFAAVAVASRYFLQKEITSTEKALALIMIGRELGLGPAASLRGIYLVNGVPSLSSRVMASLIKASGEYDITTKRFDEEAAEIQFHQFRERKWTDLKPVSVFTIKDAERAGLLEKKGTTWFQWRRNMLWARALSQGFNIHCPHLANGMPIYSMDEAEVEQPPVMVQEIRNVKAPEEVQDAEFEDTEYPLSQTEYDDMVALGTKQGTDWEAVRKHHKLKTLREMDLASYKAVMRVLNTRSKKGGK